jgi:hydrogenase-4 component B
VLTLLGLGVLALLVLAALGVSGAWPRMAARLIPLGTAAVGGLLGVVALASLAMGPAPTVALLVGPPWGPALVALDPLSAWFLLVLAVVALPAGLFAAATGLASRTEAAALPLFLAGMVLVLLAADAFTLLLGFEAMSLAS